MKKVLLALIVLALVTVGVISYFVFAKEATISRTPTGSSALGSTIPNVASFKKACDVLTQADSDAVLGAVSTKSETSGAADVVTSERSVTTCSYNIGSATSLKQATVLLRASALSEAKVGFSGAKLSDAADVSGVGEAAYWNPTYGQLNVLKGGTWMIVSVGGARVSDHSMADSIVLASRLVTKI